MRDGVSCSHPGCLSHFTHPCEGCGRIGGLEVCGLDQKTKEWIDSSSYEELLRGWRFASLGDKTFSGESGKYYSKVMFEKRDKCDHVAASKRVGWDG